MACNCANAYLPVGAAGYLIGESGGYGNGFESPAAGTVCSDLGDRPMRRDPNRLQAAVNTQTAARVCYIATTGPNSTLGRRPTSNVAGLAYRRHRVVCRTHLTGGPVKEAIRSFLVALGAGKNKVFNLRFRSIAIML